ncbi:MAG: hypothetical protein FJ010_10405 [Chloroflexi bacterium]|nr:hypothetical protein [Chloroflexota bacterium]
MKSKSRHSRHARFIPFGILLIAILFVLLIGLACNTPTTESSNQTQVSLNVQATQLSQGETQTAQAEAQADIEEQQQKEISDQQATLDAQATQAAQALTQVALDVQATIKAQPSNTPQPTNTSQPPGDQSQGPQQPPQGAQSGFDQALFETWMRSANILLFEDMALVGLVQPALDAMSLNYVDVDDYLGHFKTQLLAGAPNGQPWDLIISSKEARENVSGEFYVYLNDALNAGSSLIIEEWNLDDIGFGKIAVILGRCGVQFQSDWIEIPIDKQLLFPINGDHPAHHIPNEGIALTNPTNFWIWDFWDLGDLLKLSPGSDAKLLWGARSAVKDSYATAVSCVDGRVIIQTYGSHSYGADRIVRMWVNYIYNTLMARYQYLAAHQQQP